MGGLIFGASVGCFVLVFVAWWAACRCCHVRDAARLFVRGYTPYLRVTDLPSERAAGAGLGGEGGGSFVRATRQYILWRRGAMLVLILFKALALSATIALKADELAGDLATIRATDASDKSGMFARIEAQKYKARALAGVAAGVCVWGGEGGRARC